MEAVDRARFGRFHRTDRASDDFEDFMALSNTSSELGPRLDMIRRTMDHVFQGRSFASLDPFHIDRDFIPLVQTPEAPH